MSYVLLLVLHLGYGQTQITFQEFSSLKNCQSAIEEISKVETVEKSVCIQK